MRKHMLRNFSTQMTAGIFFPPEVSLRMHGDFMMYVHLTRHLGRRRDDADSFSNAFWEEMCNSREELYTATAKEIQGEKFRKKGQQFALYIAQFACYILLRPAQNFPTPEFCLLSWFYCQTSSVRLFHLANGKPVEVYNIRSFIQKIYIWLDIEIQWRLT